jgi:hypothetical protein
MDESKREEIALFRYGMIVPFLSPDKLDWGLKGELRRRLAQAHVNIPYSLRSLPAGSESAGANQAHLLGGVHR